LTLHSRFLSLFIPNCASRLENIPEFPIARVRLKTLPHSKASARASASAHAAAKATEASAKSPKTAAKPSTAITPAAAHRHQQ
jgi:hypothetical protein